jgi:hypothetical protein
MKFQHFVLLAGFSALAACSEDAADAQNADGTLTVSVWGEEYIEEGLPTDVFSDGWSLKYDEFLVSLGRVRVVPTGETAGFEAASFKVYDLARPSGGQGQAVGVGAMPGAEGTETAYEIAPSAEATAADGTAPWQLDRMKAGGFSLFVAGTATKGEVTKHFAWGFATATQYHECESTAVIDGNAGETQLTIHGDHLLYDDLFSSEPNVAFDLIAAADSDGDGEVTRAELEATDLSTQARYQVGSEEISDLWHFVEFLTGTVGHIDGEGHCHTERIAAE